MSIAVVYGSTTGACADIAAKIADKLGAECLNIAEVSIDQIAGYDALVLGSSTWGAGDLQDDWAGVIDDLSAANLAGKKVAVFGTGDSIGFADTFAMALVALSDAAKAAGAEVVGATAVAGYDDLVTPAATDGVFPGLAIDTQNQPELDDERIDAFVAAIAPLLG